MAKKISKAAKSKTEINAVNIGLDASVRTKVGNILISLLADEFVLYARARSFHWNVTGRMFKADHALFEDEYEMFDEVIDDIAERARALGIKVPARLSDFSKAARIKEIDGTALSAEAMILAMLDGHEGIIRMIRIDSEVVDDLDDEGTTDFLTGLMQQHEKRAWMLRSHLEG
jgi:starvation-inducible DNA-binding protein